MLLIKQISLHITLGILDLDQFSIRQALTNKRDLEKEGSKYVVRQLLNDETLELSYSPEGKPFLNDKNEHISITHSHDKLAVLVNKIENSGVDIELIRDKVRLIQHKFLQEREKLMANNETEKLIVFWSAKEALYKLYGLKGLDFIKHIFIEHIDAHRIIGKISINSYQKSYLLNWEKVDNYILVYSIYEI
jgi:phosphopantetheinyl transferase